MLEMRRQSAHRISWITGAYDITSNECLGCFIPRYSRIKVIKFIDSLRKHYESVEWLLTGC